MIEARGLSKVYSRPFSPFGLAMRGLDAVKSSFSGHVPPGLQAVKDLSFSVTTGGIVGFLGPNGAGKTTTLKMVVGFLRPTAGAVYLFGEQPLVNPRSVFAKVGGLIDRPNFYEYLTGRENLALKSTLHGGGRPARIEEVLTLVSLADASSRPVQTYSTGMKQRLGIAAAMLHQPSLLVLDEPTRGLDPKGQAEVRSVLKSIRDTGHTTILLSSHLLHEVEMICDRVIIIDQGRHLYSGEVNALLAGTKETVRVVVDEAAKAKKILEASDDVVRVEQTGKGSSAILAVTTASSGAALVARLLVREGLNLRELSPLRRSLEDFFLKVTARKEDHDGTTS